jgi:CDP-glucose 4,6-dehydratase
MLKLSGHKVFGVSLNSEKQSLYHQAEIHKYIDRDLRLDITDFNELRNSVMELNPDVIIHLAAQSLVRASYMDPITTYLTNVMGTINLLEATKSASNLKATLVITTDKVYRNQGIKSGYVEGDQLGGDDPYSSSKAAADIATQSWRKSFGESPIAVARAGNVIGGGDWAQDRLIPDTVRALNSDSILEVRFPDSIRPWQHVLDCLNGYLRLIDKQIRGEVQGEWNFGPESTSQKSVSDVIATFGGSWGKTPPIKIEKSDLVESDILLLNSSKARELLNWKEKLSFEESIDWTASWYKSSNPELVTRMQAENFLNL